MAQAQSVSAPSAATTKKTVTVVAYAANDAFKSERAMADELHSVRDYYERERKVDETAMLVTETERGRERTEKLYRTDVVEALKDADIDGDVEFRVERDVSRPYAHSPSEEVRRLRDRMASELPDELSGGAERGDFYTSKWQNADSLTLVQIDYGSLEYRRMLAHRSERNGRKKYEGSRKHLSMSFTIRLGPDTDDMIETWSDEVVGEFVKSLAGVDWVHKVRVADCKESVEKEGDCYDL